MRECPKVEFFQERPVVRLSHKSYSVCDRGTSKEKQRFCGKLDLPRMFVSGMGIDNVHLTHSLPLVVYWSALWLPGLPKKFVRGIDAHGRLR